jgi:hypothetical protein
VLRDFVSFLHALWNEWKVLLTGGSIIAALAIWGMLGKSLPYHLGQLVIGLTLVIAAFFAWRKERIKYTCLRDEIDATQLIGEIYTFAGGQNTETGRMEMFIQLSIKNLGPPTIVEGYRLSIAGGGVDVTDAVPSTIPEKFTITRPEASPWIFYGKDAIYEKTARPIEQGAMEIGWLRYELPVPINSLDSRKMKWTIKFHDIRNRQYVATGVPGDLGTVPRYYPGSSTPFYTEAPKSQ